MKVFEWKGSVGWDLWSRSVSAQLKSAKGDDVTINFSSPGGDVFDGVEIYNAISDYRRENPKAKIIFNIKGMMASMGSYIPSNPAINEVNIEENASFMIHNPWNFSMGDYQEMQKAADFLKGLADIMAPSYAQRAGITNDEAHALMDNETWFFGQEIIDNGFADAIIPAEPDSDGQPQKQTKSQALAMAKMQFTESQKRIKELSENDKFDSDRAAAILTAAPVSAPAEPEDDDNDDNHSNDNPTGSLPDDINPVPDGNNNINGGSPKVETKSELINELPAVYAESKADGVTEERERVAALMAMKKEEQYKDVPEVVAVLDDCIESGKSTAEAQPLMMAAMMRIMKDPARMAEIESPEAIPAGGENAPAPEASVKPTKIREV